MNLNVGQVVSINTVDTRGRDFRVAAKTTHFCKGGPTLYDFLVKTADEPEPTKKLRWVSQDSSKSLMLLDLYDSLPFDEGLLENANNASKPGQAFFLDDDKTGEKLEYQRVAGVTGSLKFGDREIWDFSRRTKDEAGHPFDEFLFVEKEESNGWFKIWRGREYPSFVLETL